ncbi:MAG: S8 family serine peptidase [Campylobacterales bacterium]|nr:S8 family serine peptidase [Campylobacterales bacterium]
MKIVNKMKPVKLSIIIASLVAVGCSEKKETEIYSSDKTFSNYNNSQYFPPQITISALSEDPIAKYQWHLINQGQNSGAQKAGNVGEDVNIADIWDNKNYRGKDIKIAIIDTGVQLEHPDLKENIDQTLSFNYGNNTNDPTPMEIDGKNKTHGTACAGIAAAVGYNKIGVRGVAPSAKIVGLDVFSKATEASFASALHRSDDIDIYSNSWGENAISKNGLSSSEMDGIIGGVTTGRGGLGSIYLFASGNQRKKGHNGNYYSEQNNKYVIAVSSVNAKGVVSSYSNPGSNVLISGFGGEDGRVDPSIVTTDLVGFNYGLDKEHGANFGQMDVPGNEKGEYTHLMNGTSAATPMVAGAVALVLEAGKSRNLTYRDVKYILATTARKNDVGSGEWTVNGAGHAVHHDYGFGVIDIQKAAEKAEDFTSLGEEKGLGTFYTKQISSSFQRESSQSITVVGSDVSKIEFIDIWVDIDYLIAKDLDIKLISPNGTESILSKANSILPNNFYLGSSVGYGWRFGTVRHLDESPNGQWKLKVENSINPTSNVTVKKWKIQFYGH